MDYKGNLKGDVLKHYKKTKKKRYVDNEYLKELNYNSKSNKTVSNKTVNKTPSYQSKKVGNVSNESNYNSMKNKFPKAMKPVKKVIELEKEEKARKKARKKARIKQGTVKVKSYVRKLANGTKINIRSFLRKVAKKISK